MIIIFLTLMHDILSTLDGLCGRMNAHTIDASILGIAVIRQHLHKHM